MKHLSTILFCMFIATNLFFNGCNNKKIYSGSDYSGFDDFPPNPISVQDAIRLAEPHLGKTFELRSAKREYISDKEPVLWVTLKGNCYYLVKDNYPSYTPGFYLHHAVKINKNTGEVMPPSEYPEPKKY